MSTRADVSGECSPQTLLLDKRFITIFGKWKLLYKLRLIDFFNHFKTDS